MVLHLLNGNHGVAGDGVNHPRPLSALRLAWHLVLLNELIPRAKEGFLFVGQLAPLFQQPRLCLNFAQVAALAGFNGLVPAMQLGKARAGYLHADFDGVGAVVLARKELQQRVHTLTRCPGNACESG